MSRLFHHLSSLSSREQGQSLIEFALVLPMIFLMVFGLFELCMFIYTCNVLSDAAQEGVHYATTHGTDSTICSGPDTGCPDKSPFSHVQGVVTGLASASLHNISAMKVTVSYGNGTAAPGNPVTVSIAYTYVGFLNLAWMNRSVQFTSEGRVFY